MRREANRKIAALVLGGLVLVAGPRAAGASTIVVDGVCTLIDAILAANTDTPTGSCPGGSGADVLDLQVDVELMMRFQGNTGLPPIESEIWIDGNDHLIFRNGDSDPFRIFFVEEAGHLGLQDVTVAKGLVDTGSGAGVETDGKLTLLRTTLESHQAPEDGSAILGTGLTSEVTIANSTIRSNNGGGVRLSNGGSVAGTTFRKNSNGSALDGSDLLVAGSAFISNEAAIYSGNPSAVSANGGTNSIVNSTFTENTSGSGALSTFGGLTLLRNNTFVSNEGAPGSSMSAFSYSFVYLENNIFVEPLNGEHCWREGGVTVDDAGGNHLDQSDFPCNGSFIQGGVDIDLTLSDNGGPVETHALLPGSVALDSAFCVHSIDGRGFDREVVCDPGAYELSGAPLGEISVSVFGSCPGPMEFQFEGLTPLLTSFLIASGAPGVTIMNDTTLGGNCAGTVIERPIDEVVNTITADSMGSINILRTMSAGACDFSFQVFDPSSCSVSELVPISP